MSKVPGEVFVFAGSSAPTGSLLCDGSTQLIASYPALYAEIGITYGGNGTTTFALPDMRDRMILGAGTTYSLGASGGSASKTLSVSEMPSHTHTITIKGNALSANSSDPNNSFPGGGTNIYDSAWDDESIMAATCATATNTGSGSSFSIINPYIALNYCIQWAV